MRRNKLTPQIIDIIYSMWEDGTKYWDIVTITGLSRATVGRAIKARK